MKNKKWTPDTDAIQSRDRQGAEGRHPKQCFDIAISGFTNASLVSGLRSLTVTALNGTVSWNWS